MKNKKKYKFQYKNKDMMKNQTNTNKIKSYNIFFSSCRFCKSPLWSIL